MLPNLKLAAEATKGLAFPVASEQAARVVSWPVELLLTCTSEQRGSPNASYARQFAAYSLSLAWRAANPMRLHPRDMARKLDLGLFPRIRLRVRSQVTAGRRWSH